MIDVGIVVVGVGATEKTKAERLIDSIREHDNTECSYTVRCVTESDLPSGVEFNLSRAKNIGIRDLLSNCRVIACLDCDYLFPAGLLDYTAAETKGNHLWVLRRDITEQEAETRNWYDWLKRPTFDVCHGSYNALSAAQWVRVGGWDERCYGWGGEDDILHYRIRCAGIPILPQRGFPLVHIAHERRIWQTQGKRSKQNMEFARMPQPNYLVGEK